MSKQEQQLWRWQNFEQFPQQNRWLSIALLTGCCGLAFWLFLGSTGLVDETEPLFAEASRQMTVTGDWITPYFNGATRFDKPPLVYWLTAIAYLVAGPNAWTARFASAFSATAIVVGLFFTLQRFGYGSPSLAQQDTPKVTRQRWLAAWIGAAALALNLQMIVWARTGVSDMLLCACIGGSLLCFFWGYVQSEEQPIPRIWPNRWYLAFYVLLSLAVLTKGPVGIVIPGLIIIVFSLYLGRLRQLWQEAKVWTGLGLFTVLTVPWFLLVIRANGQAYIESFFGYHNVERFTQVVNSHSAPWYFYFLVVLAGFAPWSVSLPLALARLRVWQRGFWQMQPRSSHLGLFALVWFFTIFTFFSVAVTKLPSYTIPLLPAASILIALLWSHELTQTTNRPPQRRWSYSTALLITAIANILLLVLLAIAMFIAPRLLGPDSAAPNLQAELDASWLTEIGGVIWLLGAIAIALLLLHRSTWRWIVVANGLTFALCFALVFTPALFFLDAQRQAPLRAIAQQVPQERQPGEELIMVGFQKPSVAFYTQDRVQYYFDQGDSSTNISNQSAQQATHSSLLVICHPPLLDGWELQPQDYEILAEAQPYLLLRVQRAAIIDYYERQQALQSKAGDLSPD